MCNRGTTCSGCVEVRYCRTTRTIQTHPGNFAMRFLPRASLATSVCCVVARDSHKQANAIQEIWSCTCAMECRVHMPHLPQLRSAERPSSSKFSHGNDADSHTQTPPSVCFPAVSHAVSPADLNVLEPRL